MHSLKTLLCAGVLASTSLAFPAMHRRVAGNSTTGNKLSVYWGAEDDSTTLSDVCSDDSYDIVNLAFVNKFKGDGGYPSLSISTLSGPSQAQQDAGATSLQDGSSLVSAIQACQSAGKLVIMSLGGAVDYSNVVLSGDDEAKTVADNLWNLFGGGTDETLKPLRPFGDVKLDGFDLDNESGDSTGYSALVSRFKSNFAQDSSKTYYLTAAPQCPYPDQSVPLDVCKELDYVWVQFYNNGDCNVAQSGFKDAVKTWSDGIGNAKLFIGALASGADGDQGYVDSDTLVKQLKDIEEFNLPNFGGAMLWEAQLAVKNGNYQKAIKAAL
ncbi:glycoside hydrolase family 18 protein [Talaromyces proteolyticus]|uniref:chitinase n=1 Tax=Talaromyces proteolyticus TaxID=1131652 RepID=A0AAD4KLX2_9EURO|nr:glycoside hydrolase family 18 protein [Talaromyces proteolyticus]KAH8695584.1 glycoside hydrolase family 18 protein [Talaromyces proteolyticus]